MAINGPIPVECDAVFPFGVAIVGEVTPVVDFDRSTRENRVQALDKDSGLPVWQVDVMDFDPTARDRTVKVKITASVQPVPPDAMEGAPVRPVYLEGLTVTPYLKEVGNGRSRVAYSFRATGLAGPRSARATKAA